MKSEPKPGKAVAEPLWVIALALFVIAGAVGYYGYRDLQRRPEASVAVVHAPVPVGVGVAGRKRVMGAAVTNETAGAGTAAKPRESVTGQHSPMISNAVPALALPATGGVASALAETNAGPVETAGPKAEIWNRRIIFDKDAGGIPSLPLQTITGNTPARLSARREAVAH